MLLLLDHVQLEFLYPVFDTLNVQLELLLNADVLADISL